MILEHKFLKSLPRDAKWFYKLEAFEKRLLEVHGMIRALPAGYWVRKIKGTNIFKFRLSNKDRVLFTYIESRHKGNNEMEILFLSYVSHDEQIRKGKSYDKGILKIAEATIEESAYVEEDVDDYIEEVFKTPIDLSNLRGAVVTDEELAHLTQDELYMHYLSQEQYAILEDATQPLLVAGAAGTGKTVVLVHLLGLARSLEERGIYLTTTSKLVEETHKAFGVFEKACSNTVQFATIKTCMSQLVGKEEDQVLGAIELLEWLEASRYKYRILERKELYAIATEIRGVIKGYMGLEYSQSLAIEQHHQKMLDLKTYLKIPKQYSVLEEGEKREVYKVAKAYEKWLEEKGYLDENDLARALIWEGIKQRYEWIVVDEVQDLTELQIYAISQLLTPSGHIVWAGDMNQMIYPTFFNFGRLKNLYYTYQSKLSYHPLTTNYRGTYEMTHLINGLLKMRQVCIGTSSYDYEEKAVRSGELPGILSLSDHEIDRLLEAIKDKHYCAVIVPNESKKESLLSRCPEVEGRVFLPYEIKGLEYENIYCYDFISTYLKAWKQILEKAYKNEEAMKYYFNLLYVAISRAKERLYFYESEEEGIGFRLFEDCLTIDTYDEDLIGLSKDSTKEEWLLEAQRLEQAGQTRRAAFARDHAKEEQIRRMNAHVDASYSKHFVGIKPIKMGASEIEKQIEPAVNAYRQRNYVEASEHLKVLLDKYPNEDLVYYYLGLVYGYMDGGCEYALEYFKEAIELNPNVYEYYLDYAAVWFALGKNQKVIDVLDQAIEKFPTLGNAYETKSMVYSRLGMEDLAREMTRLGKRYPKYTFNTSEKSWTKASPGKDEKVKGAEGIEFLRIEKGKVQPTCIKDIELEKIDVREKQKVTVVTFPIALCSLCEDRALCIQKKADEKGVLRIKKSTLKMASSKEDKSDTYSLPTEPLPDSEPTVLSFEDQMERSEIRERLYGMLEISELQDILKKCEKAYQTGDQREAIKQYQKLLEVLEPMPKAHFTDSLPKAYFQIAALGGIGNALFMQEQYSEAKVYLKKAIALEIPMCSEPLNTLGVIEMRAHNYEKAIEYFERALAYNKEYTQAQENLSLCRQLKKVYEAVDFAKYPDMDASKVPQVVSRLEKLRTIHHYIDTLPEESHEYETLCEQMTEAFGEITDVLLKGHEVVFSIQSMQASMFLNMGYWSYLRDYITFKELLERIVEYKKATI